MLRRHLQHGRFDQAEDEARPAADIWTDVDPNLTPWPKAMIGLIQEPSTALGMRVLIAEAHWLDHNVPFDPDAAKVDLERLFADPHRLTGCGSPGDSNSR